MSNKKGKVLTGNFGGSFRRSEATRQLDDAEIEKRFEAALDDSRFKIGEMTVDGISPTGEHFQDTRYTAKVAEFSFKTKEEVVEFVERFDHLAAFDSIMRRFFLEGILDGVRQYQALIRHGMKAFNNKPLALGDKLTRFVVERASKAEEAPSDT
jgi:hypothetical protein